MPSVTCEINVTNKFKDTKFFLFQEVPLTDSGPSGTIFSNVSKVIEKTQAASDGSSTIQFQIDNIFYAIFGNKATAGSATRISTSSYRQVKLGSEGSVVAITDKTGAIKWNDDAVATKKAKNEGGFQFITDENILTNTDKNYIGVGVTDPDRAGKVIPIASHVAEPSLNSILYPKMTYYVSTGNWTPGQLVDRDSVGKYVKLDFEGAHIPTANVILDTNGFWIDDHNQSIDNGVKVQPGDFGN